MKLRIVRDDITRLDVDAIVNAANESMLGGGGVDGAIHRAAGPRLLGACRDLPTFETDHRCPTGAVRVTPAFDLPCRYVIHTPGPVYRDAATSRPKLADCYRRCLLAAEAYALDSIAFPAISCGIYGYPINEAAGVAVGTLRETAPLAPSVREILLVAFNEEIETGLRNAVT